MRQICTVIGVLLCLSLSLGDSTRPPRAKEKNVHKSHITHHSLYKEEEERKHRAESGWYPAEDSCAKGLNVPKVRVYCTCAPESEVGLPVAAVRASM